MTQTHAENNKKLADEFTYRGPKRDPLPTECEMCHTTSDGNYYYFCPRCLAVLPNHFKKPPMTVAEFEQSLAAREER